MQRMEPTAHVRTALTWTPEGRKKRGRPRTTRGRTVMEEMRSTVLILVGREPQNSKQSDLEGPR